MKNDTVKAIVVPILTTILFLFMLSNGLEVLEVRNSFLKRSITAGNVFFCAIDLTLLWTLFFGTRTAKEAISNAKNTQLGVLILSALYIFLYICIDVLTKKHSLEIAMHLLPASICCLLSIIYRSLKNK